jgi:hypothetical protein
MFVQVLANLDGAYLATYTGRPALFDDNNESAWYSPAVTWAAWHGISHSLDPRIFEPNRPITREEMAVMLHNFIISKGVNIPIQPMPGGFTDQSEISMWAESAIRAIRAMGIITGHPDGSFAPQDTATRAQVAAIFARFLEVADMPANPGGSARADDGSLTFDSTVEALVDRRAIIAMERASKGLPPEPPVDRDRLLTLEELDAFELS